MKNEEFVKRVSRRETEGLNKRGRPFIRWKDKVGEYMSERGTGRGGRFEQTEGMSG